MADRPAFAGPGNPARPRFTAGVISAARGRHRRRLIGMALAGVCLGAGAGITLAPTRSAPSHSAGPIALERVAPAAVLTQAPDMGVACHTGSCDWVGLAVWLRQPALSVSATIAGRPMALAATHAYPRPGAAAVFVGYLRPYRRVTRAQLAVGMGPTAWATNVGQPPTAVVALRIRYRSGAVLLTRLDVPLQPGWG